MPPETLVQHLVERQVHAWAHRQSPKATAGTVTGERWIALSGEIGTGASGLARQLGERLGWRVLDGELVEAVAQRLGVEWRRAAHYDERAVGPWDEFMEHLQHPEAPTQSQFLSALRTEVVKAARTGNVILVGHGCHWLLDSAEGLRIRLVAPPEDRAVGLARERAMGFEDALRLVRRVKDSEAQFVTQAFHRSVEDATGYDLVMNVSDRDPRLIVETIASLATVRLGAARVSGS